MRVLICGNLGYVGPIVCKHLKLTRKNIRIDGLDMGYFASCVTKYGRLSDTYCDKQLFADIRDVSPEYFKNMMLWFYYLLFQMIPWVTSLKK